MLDDNEIVIMIDEAMSRSEIGRSFSGGDAKLGCVMDD